MGTKLTILDSDYSNNCIPLRIGYTINYWMASDGRVFEEESEGRRSVGIIEVKPGDILKFITNATHNSFYAFITEASTGNHLVPNTSREVVSDTNEITITVPEESRYLMVSKVSVGIDYTPYSVKINELQVQF